MSFIMSDLTYYNVSDFSFGADRRTSRVLLEKGVMQRIKNMTLETTGALTVRNGYAKDISAAVTGATGIENIQRFYHAGEKDTVVAVRTTTYNKIFKQATSSYTEITGGTALVPGSQVRFQVFNKYLFIANENVLQAWSGTGAKSDVVFTGTSVQVQPRLMAVTDRRLMVVGSGEANKNIVYPSMEFGWSTSPTTDMSFDSGEAVQIPYLDNDEAGIVALWRYSADDNLLVIRENDVYRLLGTGPNDYVLQQVSGNGGGVAEFGVCETPQGIVVIVGNEQIFAWDGAVFRSIGDLMQPVIEGVDMSSACAVFNHRTGMVEIGYLNGTLYWDPKHWHQDTRVPVKGWTEGTATFSHAHHYKGNSDKHKIVACRVNSPYLYHWDNTNQDDGTDISWEFITGVLAFEEPNLVKLMRKAQVLSSATTNEQFNVSLVVDEGKFRETRAIKISAPVDHWDDGKLWGDSGRVRTAVWSGKTAHPGVAYFPDSMRGKTMRVRVSGTGSKKITIYNIGLDISMLARDEGDEVA